MNAGAFGHRLDARAGNISGRIAGADGILYRSLGKYVWHKL